MTFLLRIPIVDASVLKMKLRCIFDVWKHQFCAHKLQFSALRLIFSPRFRNSAKNKLAFSAITRPAATKQVPEVCDNSSTNTLIITANKVFN